MWHNITNRPVIKEDLNIDLLEKFLDCNGGKQITHFTLGGDYGDSIYYPDLFELIKRFRDRVSFEIITNGSRQTPKFWNTLAELVTEKDIITFSIDGLEDTNHLYRINSDWDSIMVGLDIMVKSPARVDWKTIIFNFNYNKLAEIKDFAIKKGVNWYAEKTHRYGDATLEPPVEYVDNNYMFRTEFVDSKQMEIEPRCEKLAKVISASGYLYPCDWMRNPRTFYKSQLWKQKDRWLEKVNMKNNTYDQAILAIRDWENYVKQNGITDPGKVDVLCKMMCRKGCVTNNRVDI